jgi:hypothetical protein
MRASSPIRALCLGAVLFATAAAAFNVSVRTLRGPEGEVFTSAFVEANGERFALVVPGGWHSRAGAKANTLSLSSPSGEAPITLEFSEQDASPLLASTAALRQAVVPFLNDATVLEEFPAHTGCGAGRGLDLSFTLQGNPLRARVVVIPLTRGYASFHLSCSAENQETFFRTLGTTLTSFRRAPLDTEKEFVVVSAVAPEEKDARAAAQLGHAAAAQEVAVLHTAPRRRPSSSRNGNRSSRAMKITSASA